MTVIHRTALVEFSAYQMYDLVNDISAYPEFLPMCAQVDVHSQSATEAEATLSIVKGAIKIEFATHNDMIKNQEITIRLIKGPFKHLTGVWKFVPLSAHASKVTLDLQFEFSNRMLAMALGVVFKKLANTMLDAFCQRAKVVYGRPIHER